MRRLALASAIWNISTKRVKEEFDINKRAGAVFAIFALEMKQQLAQLQFSELTVVGTHRETNEHGNKIWLGEKATIQIQLAPSYLDSTKQARWLVVGDKLRG
ncbi:MAG: hypothetical protein IGS39_24105 [Calothrix sp. C42_A2020_038]|nr:hypothetical protein [Calothrix sp. C42_A2020_038]